MKTPILDLQSAHTQMEVSIARRDKIRKMRLGFFALNKSLVEGATRIPGPDWLTSKLMRVKGFDRHFGESIDDFDDALEQLHELWLGENSKQHPLIQIAMLEAYLLFQYTTANSGAPAPAAAAAAATVVPASATGGMLGLLAANPGLMTAYTQMQNAAPQQPQQLPQPQPPQQSQQPQQLPQPQPPQQQPTRLFASPPRRQSRIDQLEAEQVEALRNQTRETNNMQQSIDRLLQQNNALRAAANAAADAAAKTAAAQSEALVAEMDDEATRLAVDRLLAVRNTGSVGGDSDDDDGSMPALSVVRNKG